MAQRDSVKKTAATTAAASKSNSDRLSKDDPQYIFGLLDVAEKEIEEEAEESYDGQNKRNKSSIRRRIIRIRSALIDLHK
jgi:hypothetical protein